MPAITCHRPLRHSPTEPFAVRDPIVGCHSLQGALPVAHPVDAALPLEEGLLPIVLTGTLSSGEACESEIFLPHPYTFSIMLPIGSFDLILNCLKRCLHSFSQFKTSLS